MERKNAGEIVGGLRRMYFDTVSGSCQALSCTCHAFGTERLLFGTDYPYCSEHDFELHLTYLDDCGLDQGALDYVRGDRAAELLGLKGRR
jgi:aminocarboxymuconate-semialdehyde decarboxylase